MIKKINFVIFLFLMFLPSIVWGQGSFNVVSLQSEYLKNPLGIDTQQPRLSWRLEDDRQGAKQTAYRILVSTDSLDLVREQNLVWDSGQIATTQSNNIKYAGESLKPHQKYFWKVYVWDQEVNKSTTSAIASWETGHFELKNWKGSWIGDGKSTDFKPAPYFRKVIDLKKEIKEARIYISGLGYYELSINGRRVGNRLLEPAYTDYNKTVKYTTYDVTNHIEGGKNALGVILGNGWYNEQSKAVWYFDEAPWRNRPAFLLNMLVEYQDGSTEWIVSDTTWKTNTGPIIFNNIYSGEYYDARKSLGPWNTVAYMKDDQWENAVQAQVSGGKLESQRMPPIRAKDTLQPVDYRKINDSLYVYDLGQNFAGWSKINVSGPRGTTLKLKHGEALDDKNRLDQTAITKHFRFENPNEEGQTDRFILSGEGEETFTPRFTYHGYRYVEVIADQPVNLDKNSIEGIFFHTDLDRVGQFKSSNNLLNQIFETGIWSYLSNLHGIPTDCPHREKNGWTGDGHIAAEIGLYNYDGILFYEKWIEDFIDAQRPSGELPGIIPTAGWGYHWGNGPAWDSGLILIPWYLYQYYGDDTLIKKYYKHYKQYMDYLEFRAKDHIQYWGLGDWSPAETETPASFTSSCYYYKDACLLSEFAEITGHDNDQRYYEGLAENIREAINQKYFNRENYQYANGSQTALSAALYQGIVPEGLKNEVAKNLVEEVKANDYHLDVGLLGSKYLLNALTETGHADVAYKIATKTTQPSWGWWIEQGLTTFQEGWGIGPSRNHIFKGEILAWMYKALAGINPDPQQPGFKNMVIKPHFIEDLDHVQAAYKSVNGAIQSKWQRKDQEISWELTIPPNTQATVFFPDEEDRTIYESGEKLKTDNSHIEFLGVEEGALKYEIEAGKYQFKIK